jgi:hypothetical protein
VTQIDMDDDALERTMALSKARTTKATARSPGTLPAWGARIQDIG